MVVQNKVMIKALSSSQALFCCDKVREFTTSISLSSIVSGWSLVNSNLKRGNRSLVFKKSFITAHLAKTLTLLGIH